MTDELRRQARGMIVDWAEMVVGLHEAGDVFGWELDDLAAGLLAKLEPVVFEYAPLEGELKATGTREANND